MSDKIYAPGTPCKNDERKEWVYRFMGNNSYEEDWKNLESSYKKIGGLPGIKGTISVSDMLSDKYISLDTLLQGSGWSMEMEFGTGRDTYVRFPSMSVPYSDIMNYPEKYSVPKIENVIFNNPATIVYWKDKTKTIVKCQPGDEYNKEIGLAMCIIKKVCGNKGNYNDVFKKWCKE